MKKICNHSLFHLLFFIFFYIIIFFYTVSFNQTVGWSLFFFLTFLFLVDLLSFSPSLKTILSDTSIKQTMIRNQKNTVQVTFFRNKPTFIPIPLIRIFLDKTESNAYALLPFYRGDKKTCTFLFSPQERGLVTTLPFIIKSSDLLNFFSKTTHLHVPGTFLVLPEYKQKTALVLTEKLTLHFPNFPSMLNQSSGIIRNFRTCQAGDSLKFIDWKQTSKKNELIVREYEHETEPPVHLIFYGFANDYFEAILSIYYSFSRSIYTQFLFKETFLATNIEQPNRDCLFASIQPLEIECKLPSFTSEKLIIFAPEQTDHLKIQIQYLKTKNEVALITFEKDKLLLFEQDQTILIESEEINDD